MKKRRKNETQNLNFCALLNLTTRCCSSAVGKGGAIPSFVGRGRPRISRFLLSLGRPHFLAAVYFICCKQNSHIALIPSPHRPLSLPRPHHTQPAKHLARYLSSPYSAKQFFIFICSFFFSFFLLRSFQRFGAR